jgi:Phosphatidylserine synthase
MNGEKRAKVKRSIPNLFTLCNAVCGFSAIICAILFGAGTSSLAACAGLIFLAMAFDAFDGRVARTIGVTSDLGANLDSLCDAVSFGLAPAVVLFQLLHGAVWMPLLWVGGIFYLGCAVYRLARFNVETADHSEDAHLWFSGLPSTGAATVVCLGVFVHELLASTLADYIILVLVAVASWLMVSRIRFPHINYFVHLLKRK